MLQPLKAKVKHGMDAVAAQFGYVRSKPPFIPSILGHKMFQNPGDAGIDYSRLPDNQFGEVGIAKTLKPGDVVLDLGANIGLFTLLYARQVGPTGHVHSFEPGVQSFALLKTNTIINGYANVTLYNKAVADTDGIAKFLLCTTGDSDNRLMDNSGEKREEIDVELVRLDSLFGNARVDFIKMDIQGAELLAMKGLRETCGHNPGVRLLIEFSPATLEQADASPREFLELCHSYGFASSILHEDREPEPTTDEWLLANCGIGKRHPHLNLLMQRA
jgi:FkbM family methyltransferase